MQIYTYSFTIYHILSYFFNYIVDEKLISNKE